MKFRNAVIVGGLFAFASGCANLPEGFPSRVERSSPGDLFISDGALNSDSTGAAKGGSGYEEPGLKIRKSSRGNMESYVVRGERYHTLGSSDGYSARGVASWYGPNFHGRTASNGEVYDMYRLTAAHKTLPLPTYARVTHVENGRSVIVKINDRGPFSGDRIIDLSFAAALRLGMVNDGTGTVDIQALSAEEMMALSGPENQLDIDFYFVEEDGSEREFAATEDIEAEPEEAISVAAVDVDDNPITALPITTPVVTPATTPAATQVTTPVTNGVVIHAGTAAATAAGAATVAGEGTVASANGSLDGGSLDGGSLDGGSLDSGTTVTETPAEGVVVPLDELLAEEVVPEESNRLPTESGAEQSAALDEQIQDSLVPSVAGADAGLNVAQAAVQAVPLPSGKDRGGYFIQAGVYPDVADAEKVAVDVVLAAPGEEVNVKPLKNSLMYRITVGPIVSQQHASAVSGKLSAAGLENFTVNVK